MRKIFFGQLLVMVIVMVFLGMAVFAQTPDSSPQGLSGMPAMRVELTIGAGGKADNLILQSIFLPKPVSYRTMIIPVATLDVVMPGTWMIDRDMGIGLRFGFGYQGYQETPSMQAVPFFDIHGGAQFEYAISEQLGAEAGVGLSFVLTPQFCYGFNIQAGVDYLLSDSISILAQGETRFLFSGAFKPFELVGMIRLGAGYSF